MKTKVLCQAIADLILIKYLLLQAVKAYRELPNKRKNAEPGFSILLELEPQFYLGCASILMSRSFGNPGTKLGDAAYNALEALIRHDIAQNA